MGADNQAEKVLDRIARLELAEREIERLRKENDALRTELRELRARAIPRSDLPDDWPVIVDS